MQSPSKHTQIRQVGCLRPCSTVLRTGRHGPGSWKAGRDAPRRCRAPADMSRVPDPSAAPAAARSETAQGVDRHGTRRLFAGSDERGAGRPAAGSRRVPRRRDLHVAVHAKITGQEDYVYVWTLGIEGVGDGSDKLVTIGANPTDTAHYGKVISSVSVGGRHEAHHAGFGDDRGHLWAGGLDDSLIWVFDVAADPAHPKLVRTLDSFAKDSDGVLG